MLDIILTEATESPGQTFLEQQHVLVDTIAEAAAYDAVILVAAQRLAFNAVTIDQLGQ